MCRMTSGYVMLRAISSLRELLWYEQVIDFRLYRERREAIGKRHVGFGFFSQVQTNTQRELLSASTPMFDIWSFNIQTSNVKFYITLLTFSQFILPANQDFSVQSFAWKNKNLVVLSWIGNILNILVLFHSSQNKKIHHQSFVLKLEIVISVPGQ